MKGAVLFFVATKAFHDRRIVQVPTGRNLLLRLRHLQREMVRGNGAGALSALRRPRTLWRAADAALAASRRSPEERLAFVTSTAVAARPRRISEAARALRSGSASTPHG